MAHCPNGPVFSLACGRGSVVIVVRGMRSRSSPSKRVRSRRPDRFREVYLVNVNLRVRYPWEATDTYARMLLSRECDSRVIGGTRRLWSTRVSIRERGTGPSSTFCSRHPPEIVRHRCGKRAADAPSSRDIYAPIISSSKLANRLGLREVARRLYGSTRTADSPWRENNVSPRLIVSRGNRMNVSYLAETFCSFELCQTVHSLARPWTLYSMAKFK